ncbi:hypothetical protein D6851_11925 [Altericroceibacterium spongiae]|uniref:Secreted protein n=1 Tax=Altericroceibacterium spongiae TaxID=2320269 RepID=A0A420EES0_9SPHN|nr:hypothetical protein [Altericroceibacterium spongiae]RKF19181.1 hypothetical protein D6851_11925 [Altericroceibacterium spongiae]
MMKLTIAALAGTMLLAACTPSHQSEQPGPSGGPKLFLSQQERQSCEAEGGHVEKRGRLQAETCVHPFPDAGQGCTDNAQCEGKCIAEGNEGPEKEVTGYCQKDDKLFGCYAEVQDGKAVNRICVD